MDASGHSPYSSAQANLSGGLSIPGIPSSVAIGQNLTGVLGQGFNNGPPQFIQSSSTHRLDSSNSDMSHLKSLQPEERGDNLTGGSILEAAKLMQLKVDPSEEVESAPSRETSQGNSVAVSSEEQSARTLKKPRLVWTPQLHKRFVDAVAQLGIKHAVPKTIMQLMNVDGLTRENVASHLQKYRLYLKRMQGLSSDGPSSSDHLFASTPVPPSLTASAHFLVSQHGQHHDHAFGPVHNGALPRVLGNGVHHYSANISPSLSSFHGVNARAGFSTLGRLPHSPMLTGAEQGYMQQSSSQPGHMLTLFPSSGV
ncbi:hypothetical protein KP509_17G049600 [Ceratopteris richardii]|nr:hypothetical protein KP509_17G049600 [Ceratopteris richardii]